MSNSRKHWRNTEPFHVYVLFVSSLNLIYVKHCNPAGKVSTTQLKVSIIVAFLNI